MKKVYIGILLLIVTAGMNLFAQTVLDAHVRTAQRYADLAAQNYTGGVPDSAVSYAEMALAYNEYCSDALYIRALCAPYLEEPRSISIPYIEKALESNTFSIYSRDAVRITLATNYTEQRRYAEAVSVLDASPRLLTADAQYLRGLCLYATGSVTDARILVSNTWRMYPQDYRFPWLFFTRDNPADSGAKPLAERLTANLKNWNDAHPELNLYAAAFASDDESSVKLLKQYTASVPLKKREPFYAIQGLKSGYLTPAEAVERFELYTADYLDYELLDQFVAAVKDDTQEGRDAAIAGFQTWLADYSGIMDVSGTGTARTLVEYKKGRPFKASCDEQRDDIIDWQCAFDYGVPRQFTDCTTGTTVLYARYPYINSVHTEQTDWNLLPDMVSWASINVEPSELLSAEGSAFYVPVVEYDGTLPDEAMLRPASWKVHWKVPVAAGTVMTHQRDYTLKDGQIISCEAWTPDHDYSVITFENGIPVYRTTDLLCDGSDDVVEYFTVVDGEPDAESLELTGKLYGPLTPDSYVRISKINLDSEDMEIHGFTYLLDADGTETMYWDMQEDGSFSQKAVRNAVADLLSYTLIDPNQNEQVLISVYEDHSVTVDFNGQNIPVAYDAETDFYWIDEQDGVESLRETAIMLKEEVQKAAGGNPSAQINLEIDGVHYIVSKSSNWYFASRHLYGEASVN
ncbi:MAG: hypothetical protein MJ178_05635 [Treponemataceae bacterium]|nr:hypothetical protein [Treponemataceae bacterium]